MPTDFELLLQQLHGGSGANLSDAEGSQAIVIDAKRQFIIPEGYNLVLAYEGDINSQIVTFKIPAAHEGHNLGACGLKTLRWRNTSSNVEDWSNLEVIDTNATTVTLKWIVPPAAFATAGNIEIAISIYDLVVVSGQNQIAFSWNTPVFSGFVVGKTLSNVGDGPSIPEVVAPAKNEILFIHDETQSIIAPAGYNYNITTFGNRNTDCIYFQTTKVVGGINLAKPGAGSSIKISVVVSMGQFSASYEIPSTDIVSSFANGSQGTGMLSFIWRIPTEISDNAANYTGTFSIAVTFQRFTLGTPLGQPTATLQEIEQECWKTVPFHNLTIRRSLEYNAGKVLPEDYCNIIDGNSEDLDLTPRNVPGIVRLRSANEEDLDDEIEVPAEDEKKIFQNELVVIYNDSQEVSDIAIGTTNGNIRSGAVTAKELMIQLLTSAEFIVSAEDL